MDAKNFQKVIAIARKAKAENMQIYGGVDLLFQELRWGECLITSDGPQIETRTVDPRKLAALPLAKAKSLTIETEGREGIVFKIDDRKIKLAQPVSKIDPFPLKPIEESLGCADADVVKRVLDHVLPAATRNPEYGILVGEQIVSTDGHRLHSSPSPFSKAPAKERILTYEAAEILAYACGHFDRVELAFRADGSADASLFAEGIEAKMQLYTETSKFPSYAKALPSTSDRTRIRLATKDLRAALTLSRRISDTPAVDLTIQEHNFVRLDSADLAFGETLTPIFKPSVEGSGTIRLNAGYLVDALAIHGSEVEVDWGAAEDPVMVRSPSDGPWAVIMPIGR